MIFQRIGSYWNKHGLQLLVILTILFFLIYWLFFTRHKDKGSYSTTYYYDPKTSKISVKITPEKNWETNSITRSVSSSSSNKSKRVTQTSRGETICKNYLEYVFERPFQKCRPPFLYNTVTNDILELDMYNPELNLACEYNGRQHYEYVPFLHGNNRANFQNQMYRDKEKKILCRKNGVRLITVPYTIPHEKIPAFLKDEIRRLGVQGSKKTL
jgi:hypothetical protein